MSLLTGSRVGPYEILGPIGAGGMGEVYRAKDPRLEREVAVKVLPEELFEGEERRARFEREAKLLAALNHPNIAAVFSFEEVPGSPSSPSSRRHILVMELLEGETLRARLAGGALPVRKALDYAMQIVKGLAAAHEKGIVHRDLKPENLFLTSDGRVKILDFGLAKLTEAESPSGQKTSLPTASAGTEAGVVMGTLGYMSPEQVKGQKTDQRSDLFSFGAIFHEMLSGSRLFHRGSAAETISAILREDPPDLSATNRSVQPGLERIVRHCLEKTPEERFYSARDIAFDLEALSSPSGAALVSDAARADAPSVHSSRRFVAAAVVAAALAGAALTWVTMRRTGPAPAPTFRQLSFRRGVIWNARFGSDASSVLYSASWDGGENEVLLGRSDGSDARPFGLKGADVLAVAPNGDVAVALGAKLSGSFNRKGTLARSASTGGGAPRELLEDVEAADFSPDGRDLAVVRVTAGHRRLEFPPGKVLYDTRGWIGSPRVSKGGDRIAFLDYPVNGDDGGSVAVVDLAGKMTTLTPLYASARGVAWSPDGSEVWFAAAEAGGNRALRAATPSGKTRVLASSAGSAILHDVSKDGRVLASHDVVRVGLVVRAPGAPAERDLSWFDWTLNAGLSADGKTVLFTESGEGGGPGYSCFLRSTDGSPAVRLGEGQGLSLSPDGKRVLALLHPAGDRKLAMYPTGAGEAHVFSLPNLRVTTAAWLPDGRRILVTAAAAGKDSRVYLLDTEGGLSKPLTPEGHAAPAGMGLVDAKRFVARGPNGETALWPIDGGASVAVPGMLPGDAILGSTGKDGVVWMRRGGRGRLPAHVVRFDLVTGKDEPWRDLAPADLTGLVDLITIRITPDGGSYAFSYGRQLSDLYAIEGLR
jgi:hypothetical protein